MSENEERAMHTPGPWKMVTPFEFESRTRFSQFSGWYVVSEDEDGYFRQICVPQFSDANASLIAAAPDLLEACKLFVARFQNHVVNADLLFGDVADKASAAIAKATGGSHE